MNRPLFPGDYLIKGGRKYIIFYTEMNYSEHLKTFIEDIYVFGTFNQYPTPADLRYMKLWREHKI